MVKDTKNRKLFKQTGSISFKYDADELPDEITFLTGAEGWNIIGNDAIWREEYFDLSGWDTDDLTFFLSNVDFQHGFTPYQILRLLKEWLWLTFFRLTE